MLVRYSIIGLKKSTSNIKLKNKAIEIAKSLMDILDVETI